MADLRFDPPDWLALAMHWAWAVILQEGRLRQAQSDAIATRDPSCGGPGTSDWTRTESRYRLALERHFLLNAAHQLVKCVNNLPIAEDLTAELHGDVQLLRHALEHQAELPKDRVWVRHWAARNIAEDPTAQAWDLNGRAVVGGLIELGDLVAVARQIIARIYPGLRAQGFPELPESLVPIAPLGHGASVTLTDLWVHDARDLSKFVRVRMVGGEALAFRVDGNSDPHRQLEQHRRSDGAVVIDYAGTGVNDAHWTWLEALCSELVMVRDPIGRLSWGRYSSLVRDGADAASLKFSLVIDTRIDGSV